MNITFVLFGYRFTLSVNIYKVCEFTNTPPQKPSHVWHGGQYYKVSDKAEESECTGAYR